MWSFSTRGSPVDTGRDASQRQALIVQHERDGQVHLILRNLSILAPHLLLLDPCTAMFRIVFPALEIPWLMASSKLFVDVELISVTLATDM